MKLGGSHLTLALLRLPQVGEVDDAISIFIAVVLVTTVAFVQEYKSDESIAALRELAPARCVALRGGVAEQVLASDLVPGDILLLTTGDRVPADCRVLSAHGLSIDESSMTGEGRPARKTHATCARGGGGGEDTPPTPLDLADMHCILFMGTFVQSGRGRAVVVSTGASTELGGMVSLMADAGSGKSPLQERMDALGSLISTISIGIIVLMTLFGSLIMGQPLLETFTMGVSLAVAAIPEGLPVVVTVTLALSVQRMSTRQAVVKKLPAVEALGCATVVCADKTGTLTANEMTAVQVWSFATAAAPASHLLTATGSGGITSALATTPTTHTAPGIEGGVTFFLKGTGYDPDGGSGELGNRPVSLQATPALVAPLQSAAICNNSQVVLGSRRPRVVGQPTEASLLVAAAKVGCRPAVAVAGEEAVSPVGQAAGAAATPSMAVALSAATTLGGSAGAGADVQRTLEVPFSHESKWMAVRVRSGVVGGAVPPADPSLPFGGSPAMGWPAVPGEVYHVKGAVEVVLPLCCRCVCGGGGVGDMTQAERDAAAQAAARMAEQGLRVIAVAVGQSIPAFPAAALQASAWPPGHGADEGVEELGEAGSAELAPGAGMTFLGLVGIHDPPREAATTSIAALHRAGVRTIMITGDAKATAVAIAGHLGLLSQAGATQSHTALELGEEMGLLDDPDDTGSGGQPSVLSGAEVDALEPAELADRLKGVSVLYRTTPRHKLKIVQALQHAGHVVAMTGDGVNDAPALRSADIGVAMGSGTEVAKQAAHMVLLNDDLASVVQAMREGKGTFFNIRNFCRFQLSTSVAALGLVAITTMLGLPAPLSPMQVLFINVIMDGFPAISLGVEPVPRDVMQQPPRPRAEPIVTRGLMSRVLMAGVLMLLGTLLVYVQELSADGQVTTRDTTMTFATFVLFDMFNAAASRSATNSIFTLGVTSNRMFNIAVAGSLTALALLVYAPPLQAVFRTEGLSLLDWVIVTALASSVLVVDELRKAVVKRCNETDQWPVPRWLLGVEDWSGEDDAQQSVGLPEPCTRCMHDLMCCLRMRGLRRMMGWDPLPSEDPSEPSGSGRELEGPSTPHAGAGMGAAR